VIVRFAKQPGKSFKGLAVYLTHDPDKAKTSERVAWTHTLNLASDDIPSAVHEMLWTFRAADQLKRQAGVGTGGRKLESPVKHVSLNWAPADKPSREDMIEAVQDFLSRLDWQDHQAVLVAHRDKPYAHVHVMLNAIHPVTGKALDTGFEKVRASNWALSYEREHFRIYCEQRLKPHDEREPAPTRENWLKFKEAEEKHDEAERGRASRTPDYFERGDDDLRKSKEWQLLKREQHAERDAFFAEGKQAFKAVRNAVYREVRTEFRGEWKAYFEAKRNGLDAIGLAEMKAGILARQNAELEMRRDAECKELRQARDLDYRRLLDGHKQERAFLTARQAQGLPSLPLLERAHQEDGGQVYEPFSQERPEGQPDLSRGFVQAAFRSAERETCAPRAKEKADTHERAKFDVFESDAGERPRVRDGLDMSGGIGLGLIGGIALIGERLFDGFLGGGETEETDGPPPEETPKQQLESGHEASRASEAETKAVEFLAAEAARLEAYWRERRRQRGREGD